MSLLGFTPIALIRSYLSNRSLIQVLVRRDVIGRYKGSVLGLLWSFATPAFMLLIYTLFFSVVFKARWAGGSGSKAEFALVLFSGLIVFNVFSECLSRAPTLISSNVNYVKKIVFPLEILPIVSMGGAIFNLLVSVLVWLLFYVFLFAKAPPISVLFLPLILLPFIFMVLGLSWFLASLSVYLRDVGQVVGIAITGMLFMSPIFYPMSALPESYHLFLAFNPLTLPVEMTRDVLFWGVAPHWSALGIYSLVSLAVAWLGFAWFQATRRGFADVI